MNDPTRTAVALLFDDAELGGQLRAALSERGASIVHEGTLSGFDHARLLDAGASVVVVNLDDEADDEALDRLYGMLDGDRPRVVFNDAQASRGLDGWDRARWARHLAVKVMAEGDIDPPRPGHARQVDAPAMEPVAEAVSVPDAAPAASAEPVAAAVPPPLEAAPVESEPVAVEPAAAEPASIETASIETAAIQTVAEPPPLPSPALDDTDSQHTVAESETLAAELEALLAADEQQDPESTDIGTEVGADMEFDEDAPLPPLYDGDFSAPPAGEGDAYLPVSDIDADSAAIDPEPVLAGMPEASEAHAETAPVAAPAFDLDHLSLLADDDDAPPLAAASDRAGATPPAAPAWDLLDQDAPVAAVSEPDAPVRHDASDFGIEKVSAADFLAPDADASLEASPIEPGLSLELVSIEEAIAPQHYEPNEFMLDDLGSALSRLVVLGATTEGTESVCRFLSALPAGLRATLLHTQHLAGKPADGLVEYLAQHCALPVRLAASGLRARTGEVLVVPSDQQVRLLRDGSIDLQPVSGTSTSMPSIDASFTMAASAFGRDAVAIVFAGSSTDAVGGCQAIHDRGGKVWVEASSGEHFADMVSGVMAEHLSQFSGTPHELAAHLVEEFQMEGRQ